MTSSPPSQPESGARDVPTCYRHPQREAYVRCNRCERRICPDCMLDASVGHQCPECVSQGRKSTRTPRTVFGGRVARRPYVTFVLLGLIGLGFVLQQGSANQGLVAVFGMWGGVTDGQVAGGVAGGEWYRLITSAFLHGGLMHLLFNGFALFIIGRQLEDWLGHGRYLALWLLSAVGGSVLSLFAQPDQLSVGASGAIFGLFGAIFLIGWRVGADTRPILGLLAINLLITFTVPQISWSAHVGGLLTGLALAAAYAYLPLGRERAGAAGQRGQLLAHGAAVLALAVLLVGLVYLAPVVLVG